MTPPRRRRPSLEERPRNAIARMADGSMGGLSDSAMPARQRPGGPGLAAASATAIAQAPCIPEVHPWFEGGVLGTWDSYERWYPPFEVTIANLRVAVETPPAGADLIVEFFINETTSIGTVTVAAGTNTTFVDNVGVGLSLGDYLTYSITQVGSPGSEGSDLSIMVGFLVCARGPRPPVPLPCNYDAAVLADSPLIYYKLEETSGAVAADESGNGYDGTYHGLPTFGIDGPLSCDGSLGVLFNEDFPGTKHAYVAIPAFPLNVDKITMECFFKADYGHGGTILNSGNAVDLGTGTNKAWMTPDIASSYAGVYDWPGYSLGLAPETTASGDWLHWVGQIDRAAGTIEQFFDGASVGVGSTTNSSPFWLSDTGALMKRVDNVGDTWTKGMMSRFALYDYKLSSAQIAAHAAAR